MKPVVLISIIIVILLVIAGIFFLVRWQTNAPQSNENPTVCTADAKLCPDGSYVGRVPPSCEFALCPISTDDGGAILNLKLNETGSTLGVRITPLEVVEDSRCPVDAVCVWAGRVVVRARLESGLGTAIQLFTLNEPITTEAEVIELIAVAPAPQTKTTISLEDYTFTFSVKKREGAVIEPKG